MTLVPIVRATAVPRTSGPRRQTSSRNAAMGGVMTRPEVNDARRFPPSLKPETRPNAQAATSGASAKRVKRQHRKRAPDHEGRPRGLRRGEAVPQRAEDGMQLVRAAHSRSVEAPIAFREHEWMKLLASDGTMAPVLVLEVYLLALDEGAKQHEVAGVLEGVQS